MSLILCAVAVMMVGGFAAMLLCRIPRASAALGVGGVVVGSLLGLAGSCKVLFTGQTEGLRLAWSIPLGSFYVEADSLSAFFLLPVLGLAALAAIYGSEYLKASHKSLGAHWFFFNSLVASMVLVIIARNGMLFIMAWEAMSIASFFLVTFEDERESVRRAGWLYLVATHLGTVFLFIMFILMGQAAGAMDFDRFAAIGPTAQSFAGLLFVFAVIGFGAKAGFMPMHVWLPEAHPAAPSHVSAVMSGVMIKTGLYGILRVITLIGPPAAWWGWVLVVAGVISGLVGILYALSQRDLKRLLAYSSVENIGIMALGMGLGLLGMASGSTTLAVLGLAGVLLHVVNHAIFKGLLFLGAGSVLHAAGTLEIERMGGLLKRMPVTGATFLVGSLAICGLPPFNGFASEFLIYLAGFSGAMKMPPYVAAAALVAIGGLALIGGLAAACFTKTFGVIFLGEPRGDDIAHAHDPGRAMRLPLVALAGLCLIIGLGSSFITRALAPMIALICREPQNIVTAALDPGCRMLLAISATSALLLALIGWLLLVRRRLLSGREVGEAGTWDCGYARPTARMQYTGSSFTQPITDFFHSILRTRKDWKNRVQAPQGKTSCGASPRFSSQTITELFPAKRSFSTETPDVCTESGYRPLFRFLDDLLERLHVLQAGSIHLYILYIAVTLIALLIWKLS